ncbi:MAG: tetratricopeptide repeat protein [Acidobacteria bacterium]|nr:MAG: tetratricopeptide repeat protein [Acidobacteriota bacterium]
MSKKRPRRKAGSSRSSGALVSRSSPWILSPFWDSVLFIGAPLVCMAAFLPMRAYFSSRQIAVFLLAFFTFGHHLPGFLRIYGDRELFARYRLRFLLAPPLFFLAALGFRSYEFHTLFLFLSAWDIWHVLMQHYGFMRIYDAKRGATSPLPARLDWTVSLCWYLTLILNSPHYSHNLLRLAYQAGIPIIPTPALMGVRRGLWFLSVGLTLLYVGYHVHRWREGRPVSLRKLLTLGIFVGATYVLYVYIDDFLVGFTVWSAFHCVQYYGIVWAFNRNRVERKRPVTALMKFLFRPSLGRVVLYLTLIFAYGGVNYITGMVSDELGLRLLLAFVFTSNALHYYTDGFIWKVREPETRQYLDIATARAADERAMRSPLQGIRERLRPLKPGLVQAGYLAAIVLMLAALEAGRSYSGVAASRSLVALSPRVGEAHFQLARALEAEGEMDEAMRAYRRSIELLPDSWEARNNLAGLLVKKGQLEAAIQEYHRAIAVVEQHLQEHEIASWSSLAPSLRSGEGNPALVYTNLGDVLVMMDERDAALRYYRRALEVDPRSVRAQTNLGTTLAEMGRLDEAERALEKAVLMDEHYVYAHFNLGLILAARGERERALYHYRMALQTDDQAHRQAVQAAIERLFTQASRSN